MIKTISTSSRVLVIALGLLSLGACSDMDEMQQRMVSGGAIGVATGAAATVVTGGCIACGMAIGGAVGTAGGFIVDKLDTNTKSNASPPPPVQSSYNGGAQYSSGASSQ